MRDEELRIQLIQSCNPDLPAEEEQYLDTTAARGQGVLLKMLRAPLVLHQVCTFLFSGHQGCGKSTELAHFARQMAIPHDAAANQPFYPIVINASAYLGASSRQISSNVLLLSIACEVAIKLRDVGLFDAAKRLRELVEVTNYTPELLARSSTTEQLGELRSTLQRLLSEPNGHDLFSGIENRLDRFRTAVRLVISEARRELQEKKLGNLLLLVDNLEKIPALHEQAKAEALFVTESSALRSLGAHVLYTAPLRLVRTRGAFLKNLGYTNVAVLPMIKVFLRPGPGGGWNQPYEAGCIVMKQLLAKRLGGTIHACLDDAAIDVLIKFSGGDVRVFLQMIKQCASEADALPINLATADAVIAQAEVELRGEVKHSRYWRKLAELDRNPTPNLSDDADYFDMLENQLMLEYVNGHKAAADKATADEAAADKAASRADMLKSLTPWYAVNPRLREHPEFLAALAAAGR